MTPTRLIPLTGEQHDALIRIYDQLEWPNGVIREILVAWDNAPSDPAEDVTAMLYLQLRERYPGVQIADPVATMKALARDASEIVAKLGVPSPRTEQDDTGG